MNRAEQFDEDVVTIPEAWRRHLHPRRGGAAAPVAGPSRKAVEKARALAGAHPFGTGEAPHAAAVAVAEARPGDAAAVQRTFVDAWTVEHGVGFAACALVELVLTKVTRDADGAVDGIARREGGDGLGNVDPETVRRMRALLAVAGEDDHADAVERLAGVRERTPLTMWLASYLVPTRRKWVDQCLGARIEIKPHLRWLQLCTFDRPSQLESTLPRLYWGEPNRGLLATMADGMGAGIVPFLLRTLDAGHLPGPERRLLFETLGILPSDEAFRALVDRFGERPAKPVLVGAMRRFPVRALRLLAGTPAGLLDGHVRAHAELVASVLPTLPDDVRTVVEPLAAASARVPEGVPDELAAMLAAASPPKAGEWLVPEALPQVLHRDRERAVPADAAPALPALPVSTLRAACDPESLGEFGRALFRAWQDAGAPSGDRWALAQLGRTGDDATVRWLAPLVRAWPGEGRHRHAAAGLDVLAEIGSDLALTHLHSIARKARYKGLRERAREKIEQVARSRGLTADELADRLVPAFGLDAAGTMVLDYGPRRFTVGFTERLAPYVADESGGALRTLPKPGARDERERASAAYKAFAALKKDVRAVAAEQVGRLEEAMLARRRWSPDEFRAFFADHPLVRHLARRLVWTAGDGADATAFRIAEDGTLADAADAPFVLPASARIGIPHPLDLNGSVDAWSEVFADYEILQPFPQLGRPVHALTDGERGSGRLERFEGTEAPSGSVLGLVRRGWERGAPQDAGAELWISREVAGGRHVVVGLDPGFQAGAPLAAGDRQTLERVWLARRPGSDRNDTPLRFGDLDPVVASEFLADLESLTGAAT